MKNLKKIVAFVLVASLMLVSSISVSAFTSENATKYTLKIEAPSTAKIGETFTVKMYIDSTDTATMSVSANSSNLLTFSYDNTKLTLGNTTPANSNATFGAGALEGWLDYSLESKAATFTPGETIATAEFTADEAGTYTFALDAEGYCSMGTVTFLPASMGGGTTAGLICDPITVTVTAGSTDKVVEEETFETVGVTSEDVTSGKVIYGSEGSEKEINMGTNGKIYTIFQKTNKNLTAKTYGVTAKIGDKTYKFPGLADVTIASGETEAKWAIKLILPEGKLLDSGSVVTLTNITPYVPAE